jgi:hypothetical protein
MHHASFIGFLDATAYKIISISLQTSKWLLAQYLETQFYNTINKAALIANYADQKICQVVNTSISICALALLHPGFCIA